MARLKVNLTELDKSVKAMQGGVETLQSKETSVDGQVKQLLSKDKWAGKDADTFASWYEEYEGRLQASTRLLAETVETLGRVAQVYHNLRYNIDAILARN